jgi:hypothetical protein
MYKVIDEDGWESHYTAQNGKNVKKDFIRFYCDRVALSLLIGLDISENILFEKLSQETGDIPGKRTRPFAPYSLRVRR